MPQRQQPGAVCERTVKAVRRTRLRQESRTAHVLPPAHAPLPQQLGSNFGPISAPSRRHLGAISAAISARARRSREPVPERLLAALGQQAIER